MLLWSLLACAPDVPEPEALQCDGDGGEHTLLIQQIRFARVIDGQSRGFDLDGERDLCGVEDFRGPNGEPGIDNAFANLLPALEATEARTMEDVIADSIRSGRLLILVGLHDLDDIEDDACVDVSFRRGAGAPFLGNDGEVLAGQTFDLDDSVDESRVFDMELDRGVIRAAPLDMAIPVQIFEYAFDFSLLGGVIEVRRHDDGRYTGVLAGGLPIESVLAVASNPDVDPALLPLIEGLLPLFADLDPDDNGVCQSLSMTFEFDAVEAFVF